MSTTSSEKPTKRRSDDLELPFEEPHKSRRLDFMKYAIRLDPKAYEFLVNQSALAYLFFSIGNPLKAAVAYEDFLGLCSRSHWSTSIIEGGQLVIIQSIFNLTRCYLALGQSDKAQDTLQELWDPTSTKSISFGHSLFSELAWLYYEVKDACSKPATKLSQPKGL
ncbi:hypothetical protein PCANC_27051 [Puccinia coronata f. sp. avenae]|uniref:Uncharacterized protein n=1 Tax=Puccinia coronata f. sp. avenae TaxID=200324 RepID=A0A2N5TK39_9BASI|nr:hypothetical protein PCANC_27051 [Puccinia coronata f. sp. avenae]